MRLHQPPSAIPILGNRATNACSLDPAGTAPLLFLDSSSELLGLGGGF